MKLLTLALLLVAPILRGADSSPTPADTREKFAIGIVVDPGGAPVEGAEIRDTGTSETATTDKVGRFVLRWADAKSPCHGMLFATKGTDELGWIYGQGLATVTDKDAAPSFKITVEKVDVPHSGKVVDEKGTPVAGARVEIDRLVTGYSDYASQPIGGEKENRLFWDRFTTTTDDAGHFGLALPHEARAALAVSAPGRASLHVFEWNGMSADTPLVMPPGGAISGRLINKATGAPLPKRVVRADWKTPEDHVWSDANAHLGTDVLAVTDDAGNYTFTGLRLGTFEVGANRSNSDEPKDDLVPDPVQTVEVLPGKTATADLSMSPGKSVSGRVLEGDTNKPISSPLAIRFTPGPKNSNAFRTKNDGTFTAWLHPGKYEFQIEDDSKQFGPVPVVVPADGDTPPVLLRAGNDVAGITVKIRTPDGSHINDYDAVKLWEADDRGPRYPRTSGDEFTFSGIQKGKTIRVIADVPGYAPVISQPLVAGESTKLPDILLTPVPQLTLSGTLLDAATGKPLEGAQIRMQKFSDDGVQWEVFHHANPVTTDKDGRFSIQGLHREDRLKLQVMRKDERGAWTFVQCDNNGAFSDSRTADGAFTITDSVQLPPVSIKEIPPQHTGLFPMEPPPQFPPLRPLPSLPPPELLPPGGICVIINNVGDKIVVTTVFPGGPAEKAGIKTGDIILEVEGQHPSGLLETSKLTRGDIGTKVHLTVQHRGEDKPQTFEITRQAMIIKPSGPGRPVDFSTEHRVDPKTLENITLPENPTKEQVRSYIEAITLASAGQNIFGSTDPQIKMLEKVGHDNLDLLLEALSLPGSGSFYLLPAIDRLAQPGDRDVIVASLPQIPKLIEVIQGHSWTDAAKPRIHEILAKKPGWVSGLLVKALASLRDPSTYDDLTIAFSRTYGKYTLFETLRTLPGFDVQKAVDAAWEFQKTPDRGYFPQSDPEDYATAILAAQYGHKDALDYLFKVYDAKVKIPRGYPDATEAIRSAADIPSTEDPADWYRKSQATLHFDEAKKKFVAEQPAKR